MHSVALQTLASFIRTFCLNKLIRDVRQQDVYLEYSAATSAHLQLCTVNTQLDPLLYRARCVIRVEKLSY